MADVAVGDVDDDGDLDVVAAVFGLVRGSVLLLENQGSRRAPRFVERVLDDRPSAVDVELADLDGDGQREIVALLSNQYETVIAYRRRADGAVEQSVIARADDPTWGSSGLELVDLDADGDLDVIWSHGDAVDAMAVTTQHGVHWIENLGGQRFRAHALVFMPGATTTRSADLDADGDLDVVVAATLPPRGMMKVPLAGPAHAASLAWLEQREGHQFVAHVLELDRPQHTALELRDADADGDLDIFVSELNPRAFSRDPSTQASADAWVSVWLNGRADAGRSPRTSE